MKKAGKKNHGDVIAFLDSNPGFYTFGEVAEALGYTRETGGQAVGAMMRAIHKRGFHEYCRRVVNNESGEHGCDTTLKPKE
jgi:alkylated DNA nucleotide flippase Atl1